MIAPATDGADDGKVACPACGGRYPRYYFAVDTCVECRLGKMSCESAPTGPRRSTALLRALHLALTTPQPQRRGRSPRRTTTPPTVHALTQIRKIRNSLDARPDPTSEGSPKEFAITPDNTTAYWH
jgi:hypothetical protein